MERFQLTCLKSIKKSKNTNHLNNKPMPVMIIRGKELLRINPKNTSRLEVSTNEGRTWNSRYSGSSYGNFSDLSDTGKELLGITSKGLYYSRNDGRTWNKRS